MYGEKNIINMNRDNEDRKRSIKECSWYWIDRGILKLYGRIIKPSGIAVYSALAYFANNKNQACFPSQRAIANLVGLERRTVIRKIGQAKRLGLISVVKKRGSCLYVLLSPIMTKRIQPCVKKRHEDVSKMTH